jgi:bacterioferritin
MKGNDKIVERLNDLLADELTATGQYMVHSEMCANWGYLRLHDMAEKRAITEMKHAEDLIGRLLFLEGVPIVSHLKTISIGSDVPAQLENDRKSEEGAIKAYNDAMKLAGDLGDNGTRQLLGEILEAEEEHIDELETQLDQIKQLGLQIYLSMQLR